MKKLALAAIISSFAIGATAGGMDDAKEDGMDEMAEPMMEEPEVDAPGGGMGGQGLLILLAIAAAALALG